MGKHQKMVHLFGTHAAASGGAAAAVADILGHFCYTKLLLSKIITAIFLNIII